MKKKISLLISAWMIIACSFSTAQVLVPGAFDYHELALTISQYNYNSSARIQGIGNAQISLGGDISSALSNPAGLGFYNRSEFSFTPSVNNYSIESNYLGKNFNTTAPKFNFDNFGLAMHKKYNNSASGFVGGTFAISFSKVNEFNYNLNINGLNTNNDIIDYFVDEASFYDVNEDLPLLPDMAYSVFLIDVFQDPDTEELFFDRTVPEYPSAEFPVDQREDIEARGSQNQWSFSYGANYKDRLYLGAGIGITSLNYEIEKYYTENYASGSLLMDMSLLENLIVTGTGINGTFGIIGRPINQLTVGASIITPTLYNVSEDSRFIMTANFDNLDHPEASEPLNYVEDERNFALEYNISTPTRINGGISYFISKYGFISADVEWVDYSKMNIRSNDANFSDQEAIINDIYSDVVNFRIGAEGRLDNFRIRAGYGLTKSPYVDESINRDVSKISGGLGYRNSDMFIDFTTTYASGSAQYSPYSFAPGASFTTPTANLDYNNLNFILSVGFFY